MNFKLLSAFAALSIFSFAAAEEKLAIEENLAVESVEENLAKPRCLSPTEKCTLELEGIVYQPETAARLYLNKISEEIKCAGPILWSSQADNYIQSFEGKYQVSVFIRDPFRNLEYPNLGKSNIYDQNYLSTTSVANMNGSGFAVDADSDERVIYEFIVFNPYGELKYVMISMPLSEAPSQFASVCK